MRRCRPSSARRGVLAFVGPGLLLASAAVAAALPAPPVAPVAGAAALPEGVDTLLETLPPAQRAVLRQRVERWQSWTPEARAAFAERAASWDALPPLERGRRREAWHAWRALPPMQREQVGGMSREFAARPVEEREALRARFQALDTSVQRGWLLGPVLGADYWRLHGLLAQVPVDQRAPLLEVLAAMTAAQRAQLYVLVQRTAPQDRDALRRELLATPAGRRQQWLWEQLDR